MTVLRLRGYTYTYTDLHFSPPLIAPWSLDIDPDDGIQVDIHHPVPFAKRNSGQSCFEPAVVLRSAVLVQGVVVESRVEWQGAVSSTVQCSQVMCQVKCTII